MKWLTAFLLVSISLSLAGGGPAPLHAGVSSAAEEGPAVPAWGLADETMLTFGSFDFEPYEAGTTTGTVWGTTRRYVITPSPYGHHPFLVKTFSPPQGALITRLSVLACNTSLDAPFIDFFQMHLDGTANSLLPVQVEIPPDSGCTTTTVSGIDHTVDASTGPYMLMMGFNVLNENQSLAGMQVFYRLQASPPPVVATFTDVPTGHALFQYVEALAAAGITSGCGGGNFCPNAPVTRGQMAVFLTKALGLHWAP